MIKPKIRFKGYQEEWEQRKLGEVIEGVSKRTPMDYIHKMIFLHVRLEQNLIEKLFFMV